MKTFREFMILAEEGATSARLADVARQRINKTRDFSVLPQGKPSLSVLSNLERNAQQRSSGTYPQQSGVRRGEGGAGVPARSLDPVRIKPSERHITSREINRRASERDANRNVPLTRKEVPVPIKSQPTPPSYRPTSRTKTPLTPQVRDQRAAAAGFSGQGSTPKGPKLYRQTMRGVSTGDDPMSVLRSAATPPKPTPKPKSVRGGSSSLSNVGRGVNVRPSGTGRFTPGTGGNFGISGIGLAN
jgi:hypothetical protein